MLFYVLRFIINLIERNQKMIKKYSKEKRQEVINARKAGLTIAQIAAQTAGRAAEGNSLKNHRHADFCRQE